MLPTVRANTDGTINIFDSGHVKTLVFCTVTLDIPFDFFFQAEAGIRDVAVTGVQTCALPISSSLLDKVEAGRWDIKEVCERILDHVQLYGIQVIGIEKGSLMRALTPYLTEMMRSEERRVGKECRSRWSPEH